MADKSCSHDSKEKRFFFKWWLCPLCYSTIMNASKKLNGSYGNKSINQNFKDGISIPEVKRHSGNIVFVDNRPAITRSVNQKEDIKIVLQF